RTRHTDLRFSCEFISQALSISHILSNSKSKMPGKNNRVQNRILRYCPIHTSWAEPHITSNSRPLFVAFVFYKFVLTSKMTSEKRKSIMVVRTIGHQSGRTSSLALSFHKR